VVIRSQIRIPDHFFISFAIAECDILGIYWYISYSHRPLFTNLVEMTDANNGMGTQRFVSKPSISQRSQIKEDTVEPSVPAREF